MILQKIIFPDTVCEKLKLYYQANVVLEKTYDFIRVPAREKVSFFSYMNMFDIDAWKKYSRLRRIIFQVQAKGNGTLFLKTKSKHQKKDKVLRRIDFGKVKDLDWNTYQCEIHLEKENGCCYFELFAESEVWIKEAYFSAEESEIESVNIKLAINICTYNRNTEINRNLELLRNSRFFKKEDMLYQKLQIIVVDNGSQLNQIDEPYIRLVHNPNTGGSGGFKRGLEEIRTWQSDTTHVVFMDDDAEFQLESIYRLYALLSYMKAEYVHEAVAGRMFRADTRHVQYTAAEIWNKGDLLHIGVNADMTIDDEVLKVNDNTNAEYGGWWFCCYPMEFAKENAPLPFFLHCDDVEYGLRHGGTPIILNGIQVWHETYEYRQSPVMLYYDTRNSLVVNYLYHGYGNDKTTFINDFKAKITAEHIEQNYLREFMIIKAYHDFLKGNKWFNCKDDEKLHKRLAGYKKANRYLNALFWRIVFKRMMLYNLR